MSFWAKRKAAVEAEARADLAAQEQAAAATRERALAEKPDDVLLAEAGLPEPEKIEGADQLQAFLKAQVPQRLKARALRHHWGTNPVLANLDGLLEYGEDYTDAARCVPGMKTAYKVGIGMFDKVVEAARATEAAAQPDEDGGAGQGDTEAEQPLSGEPAFAPHVPEDEIFEAKTTTHIGTHTTTDTEQDPQPDAAPVPRRMRFRFDT